MFSNAVEACNSFQLQSVDGINASVDFARHYQANEAVNVTSYGGQVDSSSLPAFCRVKLIIHTSNSTEAETEVWLPDDYVNRTVGFGNGGWSGGVVFDSLAYDALERGYAGFSTNNGHNGSTVDMSWAYHNPESVEDFGHRAMHQSSVAARAVAEQYYGQAPEKNYYLGCSTGGRQGLASVILHPDDFDGVVIGSPATPITHLGAWSIWINNIGRPVNGSEWITDDAWQVIKQGVIDQCDALDGLEDGIISDPLVCKFRPELLACRPGQDASSCLSLGQISTIKKAYKPLYGSKSDDPDTLDTEIFSGYLPGGEDNYAQGLMGEHRAGISVANFRNAIFNDTEWDPLSLDFNAYELSVEVDPGRMNLFDPNITAFAQRGGKLLHYVGMGDQLIAAGNSLNYADLVHGFTLANTRMDPASFYKLYTVPGMGHCNSGRGANAFGGEGQRPTMPALKRAPSCDIFEAMVAWVEEDAEPGSLTAVKYTDNDVDQGVAFERPLCVYPKTPRYKGGDKNKASSFECC